MHAPDVHPVGVPEGSPKPREPLGQRPIIGGSRVERVILGSQHNQVSDPLPTGFGQLFNFFVVHPQTPFHERKENKTGLTVSHPGLSCFQEVSLVCVGCSAATGDVSERRRFAQERALLEWPLPLAVSVACHHSHYCHHQQLTPSHHW